MPFDKVVEKIAGLGVPGLILLFVMSATGWAGGAAIVTALALLGGPFGMLGGIAALLLLGMISQALAKYGFGKLGRAVILKMKSEGKCKPEINAAIGKAWYLSLDLRAKLLRFVDEAYGEEENPGEQPPEPDGSPALP